MYQSSCTFLLKNTSKENTHGIPITTLSSQREILKIVLNSRPLFLFWPKWNKNCITTMKWNTCRPSDVFQENRSNVFPTLISVAALMRFWCVRFLFHVTWRFIYVHAWRPKYCIANGIFTVAAVTIKCELPISIHNRWPEWLALLTNGH